MLPKLKIFCKLPPEIITTFIFITYSFYFIHLYFILLILKIIPASEAPSVLVYSFSSSLICTKTHIVLKMILEILNF